MLAQFLRRFPAQLIAGVGTICTRDVQWHCYSLEGVNQYGAHTMVALIGMSCMMMAVILAFTDPFNFDPNPQLQAIVWACFGIWCFVTAWNQRNWHPSADNESGSRNVSPNGTGITPKNEGNVKTSSRNPLAALANVHERMALDEPDDLNRAHRYRIVEKARELASKEPVMRMKNRELSAREALLKPVDEITDLEELKAIIRKLQQIAKESGSNDLE